MKRRNFQFGPQHALINRLAQPPMSASLRASLAAKPCPECTTAILNRRPGYLFVSGPAGGGYYEACGLCDGKGTVSA